MSYRDDVDALAARHAALEADAERLARERDAAGTLLEEARARSRLPVLDNIRVASPCKADWNAMTGDERVRHCAHCDKQVFNLSEMTRAEAEALLVERIGNLCARYYQRSDGTILLADCTVGVARKRKVRMIAAGAAALLAVGGGVAYRMATQERPKVEMLGGITAPATEDVEGGDHVTAHEEGMPEEPKVLMGQAIVIDPAVAAPAQK